MAHSLNLFGGKPLVKRRATVLLRAAVAVLAAGVVTGSARQLGQSQPGVTMVAAVRPIADLLPPALAGFSSKGDVKQYQLSSISDLIGEKASIFLEYGVDAAAARDYGDYRVLVFQTPTPSQAFGLFTYNSAQPVDFRRVKESSVATARTGDGAILWKGSFFVYISATRKRADSFRIADRLSSEIAGLIGDSQASGQLTGLPESLPSNSSGPKKVRYFLGNRALSSFVEHAGEMYGFEGRAEATLAEYDQAAGNAAAKQIGLLIVEYNTPQFSKDALARAIEFATSLPEDEQRRIIIKREGNYIVEATGFTNHEVARQLVDSVKYPYTVKWLKDPHSRSYDRFAGQKAAQIILSSFGIVGVLLMAAFVGGGILGTVAFIRRRRRQVEVFTDAGGMLCLDIDRLCTGTARMELASGGATEGGVT